LPPIHYILIMHWYIIAYHTGRRHARTHTHSLFIHALHASYLHEAVWRGGRERLLKAVFILWSYFVKIDLGKDIGCCATRTGLAIAIATGSCVVGYSACTGAQLHGVARPGGRCCAVLCCAVPGRRTLYAVLAQSAPCCRWRRRWGVRTKPSTISDYALLCVGGRTVWVAVYCRSVVCIVSYCQWVSEWVCQPVLTGRHGQLWAGLYYLSVVW